MSNTNPTPTPTESIESKLDRLTNAFLSYAETDKARRAEAPPTSPEIPTRTAKGRLHGEAAQMIIAGKSNLQIVADLGIDLPSVQQLRAAATETTDRLAVRAGGLPRANHADRTFCQCGGLQSMHAGGHGYNAHTGCPKFVAATDQTADAAEDAA